MVGSARCKWAALLVACLGTAAVWGRGSVAEDGSLASSDDEPPHCEYLRTAERHPVLDRPLMVYLGSARLGQPGFIAVPYEVEYPEHLDVTNATHYKEFFCKGSVDVFFTEHTFEHIPEELHQVAFRIMYEYLKPGGLVRTAVPTFPDRKYFPDFNGSDLDREHGHVAFPSERTMTESLRAAGFTDIEAVEQVPYIPGEDGGRAVITRPYDSCMGRVQRSIRHDPRNAKWLKAHFPELNVTKLSNAPAENYMMKSWKEVIPYDTQMAVPRSTSLIIDAWK